MGQFLKIKDRVKNQVFGTKYLYFFGLSMEEKEGEKEMNPSLLLTILEVHSIGNCRAKN